MIRLCKAVTLAGPGNLEPAGADSALSGTGHKRPYAELSIRPRSGRATILPLGASAPW